MKLTLRNYTILQQHILSVAFVLFVSASCFVSETIIGYKIIPLILLMTVSLIAMVFDMYPVLISAILSALIWNFFFIPPLYTFHIDNANDLFMFLLYFFIALVNAVLTIRIRKAESHARDKEEKENTIKLYNTLINSLSHELRTPISTIIGAIDTLQNNKDKLSLESNTELLNEIDKASIRLNQQVENLLNMSRLETGMLKLHLDWCDLEDLIYSVINKNSNELHPIYFVPNENLPIIKIDAGLIEQVLQNIIQNAIQYTPPNTPITIEAIHANDECVITISDIGNGFSNDEMVLAFNKFYRAKSAKTGGCGLGLSIAKGFVESHNGRLILEKNIPNGAKFIAYIPAPSTFINHLKNE